MNPWIILDRDGVINEGKDEEVASLEEWRPFPGSVAAIAALSKAGFKVVIVTNQSGVAEGLLTVETLEQIHETLRQDVIAHGGRIEGIFYCPHEKTSTCDCRKPRTGLLDEVEMQLGANLIDAHMVGDSLQDIRAARAKGCLPVLVRTGAGTQTETTTLLWPQYGSNILIFDNLAAFADSFIRNYSSCL
jgi:D-glycero-D-manno-heptose 1,7-bisphosphate phosphatase